MTQSGSPRSLATRSAEFLNSLSIGNVFVTGRREICASRSNEPEAKRRGAAVSRMRELVLRFTPSLSGVRKKSRKWGREWRNASSKKLR